MPTELDHLRALTRICRVFGGRLAIVSQREFDRLFDEGDTDETPWDAEDLSASPFTCNHGLWWRRKIVYAVRGREEIGSIIHEMGHVFAAQHHPYHGCSECHEWNWLGWEITLARQIGAYRIWSRQNENYSTADDGEWGKISAKRRRSIIVDRLALAKKIGVVGDDGPRSIR